MQERSSWFDKSKLSTTRGLQGLQVLLRLPQPLLQPLQMLMRGFK